MKTPSLFAIALLGCSLAYSQARMPVVQTSAALTTTVKPAALNMKQVKLSAAFASRQQLYGTSFTNPSKRITYSDGTALNIQLVKNPSFGDQSTNITAHVSGGGPVHTSTPGWACTSSNVQITATSTSFLNADYSAQASHIYPGAVYTFDNFFNGSYHEETAARNPIILSTDNPNINGSSYVTVSNPNMATIRDGIAQLYSRFTNTNGTGNLSYTGYESNNSSDMNLKVTAGGSGYGFTFNNVFTTTNKSQHVYMTIDARKSMFTINVAPQAANFFTSQSEESTPNLVILGSVTYGARILANLDITFSSASDANTFSAKYNGEDYNANVDLNWLANNSSVQSTINCYVVGGPGSSTISFDKSQLQTQLQNILSNVSYANARPISFQLYDMAGDIIGSQSATDQFALQNCIPAAQSAPAVTLATAYINGTCGSDGKDNDTHFYYTLYNSAGNVAASYSNTGSNSQYTNYSSFSTPLNVNTSALQTDFKNGGRLHLHIEPNGHDTWDIQHLTLSLSFANGSPIAPMTWNSIVVSQDNKDYDFSFDGGFQPH
jgi:thiol-activated cytolysin